MHRCFPTLAPAIRSRLFSSLSMANGADWKPILDERNRGAERITHLLSVNVLDQPDRNIGNEIVEFIHSSINEIPHAFTLNGNVRPVMWSRLPLPGVFQDTYFYTNSIWTDMTVDTHTNVMFNLLKNQIETNPDFGWLRRHPDYHSRWRIMYLLTRPLNGGMHPQTSGTVY